MYRGYFFAEYARKIEENAGKIGEFPRNPFLEVAELKGDPAVVSGRFRSFSLSFPVIPGYDSDSFRFLSVFIPFHSFSFLNPLFYALKHKKVIYFKISPFLFGSSNYSSYFCQRLTDDSKLSGRATVSPMASQPQAFFMPKSIIFPATGKRCTYMAAA